MTDATTTTIPRPSPTTLPWMPLTEQAVAAIDALDDGALRNLWITQSYADLGRRLLDQLHTDQTWCTFAIWASQTAGLSIRGEELPRFVAELLLGRDDQVDALVRTANGVMGAVQRSIVGSVLERSHIEHLVATAVAQVSASIAAGNLLVYRELAPIFVRFVECLERGHTFDAATIGTDLDALGVPPSAEQPLVWRAFQQYALATTVTGRERAEHVLAANIAAVLHEQQRLQPAVVAALDAGLLDVGRDICGLVPAADRRDHPHLDDVARHVVTAVRAHIAPYLERLWQDVATALLMTLRIPGETLHLGRDVPPPDGEPLVPAEFVDPTLPALVDLLHEWDPTHGTGRGSGAHDWADLRERMGYIVTLFRSRQRCLGLTRPPFDASQLASMAAGEVPPTL